MGNKNVKEDNLPVFTGYGNQTYVSGQNSRIIDPRFLEGEKVKPPQIVIGWKAWLKLIFFLHAGPTEVCGMAVTSKSNALEIEDFVVIKQRSNSAFTRMDTSALATDYMIPYATKGISADRTMRIWWHTHPGSSPNPSHQDESTFRSEFSGCEYRIMFIISRTHTIYCRLTMKLLGISMELPVIVRKEGMLEASDDDIKGYLEERESWPKEYLAKVTREGGGGRSSYSELVKVHLTEEDIAHDKSFFEERMSKQKGIVQVGRTAREIDIHGNAILSGIEELDFKNDLDPYESIYSDWDSDYRDIPLNSLSKSYLEPEDLAELGISDADILLDSDTSISLLDDEQFAILVNQTELETETLETIIESEAVEIIVETPNEKDIPVQPDVNWDQEGKEENVNSGEI